MRRNNKNEFGIGGWIASIAVAAVVFFIFNFLAVPRVGWSFGLLSVLLLSVLAGWAVSGIADYVNCNNSVRSIIFASISGILALLIIISAISSWT